MMFLYIRGQKMQLNIFGKDQKHFLPFQNNIQGNRQLAIVIEMDEKASDFPQSISSNVLEKNMKCCCSLKIATLWLNY
ncbi:unnamed protein product [Caretta caretta]